MKRFIMSTCHSPWLVMGKTLQALWTHFASRQFGTLLCPHCVIGEMYQVKSSVPSKLLPTMVFVHLRLNDLLVQESCFEKSWTRIWSNRCVHDYFIMHGRDPLAEKYASQAAPIVHLNLMHLQKFRTIDVLDSIQWGASHCPSRCGIYARISWMEESCQASDSSWLVTECAIGTFSHPTK